MSRRNYTADYKLRVLAEYERLPHGSKGAYLRREGLTTSIVSQWRAHRDAAGSSVLARGPGRPPSTEAEKENAALRQQIATLHARVADLEAVVEAQGRALRAAALATGAQRGSQALERRMTRDAVRAFEPIIGLEHACRAAGISRATYYRWQENDDER